MERPPGNGSEGVGPSIIHFKITGTDPAFARSVLRKAVYEHVVLRDNEITASIAPTDEEIHDFRIHPMVGNAYVYQDLLARTGYFVKESLRDTALTRETVMYYQIYLDPVVVTAVENYLWTCNGSTLQRLADTAGFPIGTRLAEAKKARGFTHTVDRYAVVKAMVEAGGVTNCLPMSEAASFLLSVRLPEGSSAWLEMITHAQ